MAAIDVRRTRDLSDIELTLLWALVMEAYSGDLSQEDWQNAQGGLHIVASEDGQLLSHAAVLSRTLVAGGRPLLAGYVEALATRPRYRKQGHATAVMQAVTTIVRSDYELGALSTGSPGFYSRLDWEPWRGPTYAQAPAGRVRTSDDDTTIMVMRTVHTYNLDDTKPLVCDWREGKPW